MKKILSLLLLSLSLLNTTNVLYAQKNNKTQKTATVYKKDGTIITGNVKNFEGKISFEKVDPWYLYKRLWKKDMPNYFALGPQALEKIKIKPNNEKKFQEIPLEEIEGILFKRSFKGSGGDKVYFKTFIGEKYYGKKRNKEEKIALPTLTEGKAINTYGSIFPIRSIWPFFPGVLIETKTPEALGVMLIENTNKNLSLSLSYIKEEKSYSLNKAKRREKSNKNKNHNTLKALFGDCPETMALIDKYYIKRIENTKERRLAAEAYNETYKKNVKNFKKIIRKDRNKATGELYLDLYEFDLAEIIATYEKHCLPIDEFDPRHEQYKKEFDIINRETKDTIKQN